MSLTTNVSASRLMTTPLTFIFSPLATEREPLGAVVSCAATAAADTVRRASAITKGDNILNFGNFISLISFMLKTIGTHLRGPGFYSSDVGTLSLNFVPNVGDILHRPAIQLMSRPFTFNA